MHARAQESHSVRDDERCRPEHLLSVRWAIVRLTAHGSRLTAHDKGHAEEREEWHDGQQPFRPQQRLVAPAATGFWAYCSFDLARMGEWEVRTFSQLGWVVLLVFTNVLGALMLFAVGRPQRR